MSKSAAEAALIEQVKKGQDQQRHLVELVSRMVIRDRLVPPTQMSFDPQFDDLGGVTLFYRGEGGVARDAEPIRIHRHALNQLALKIHYPMSDVNYLLSGNTNETIWRRELLAYNLNERFHKEQFKSRGGRAVAFLHRLVGNELRGFLSRSFNRHLASAPMLQAFLSACQAMQAKPVEAITSDVRLSLKCFLPLVFEPVPGEFIAVGVDWKNSDFGSGKLTVSSVIFRTSSRTAVTLSDDISQVHLGSVIEESDIEMSDETLAKEVEAQAGAIHDTVKQLLSDEYIGKLVRGIQRAAEEEVPWSKLKGQLSKFFYKEELESVEGLLNAAGIVDLPPVGRGQDGQPLPTRWWVSNVVSFFANKADEDRKIELQREAGRFLDDIVGP